MPSRCGFSLSLWWEREVSIEGDVLFERQKLGMTEIGAQVACLPSDIPKTVMLSQESIGLMDASSCSKYRVPRKERKIPCLLPLPERRDSSSGFASVSEMTLQGSYRILCALIDQKQTVSPLR